MNRFLTFIQMTVGAGAILAAFKRGTVTYRFSTKPFPNQRLGRIGFLVIGVGLLLGGLLSLWVDWHFVR